MPVSPPNYPPPRPTGTPDDVDITWQAREPVVDPTLGIPVEPPDGSASKHRFVTVGDSLTHGFQSLAIFKTGLSWPALVAKELGILPNGFHYPTYDGYGGLPFNLELCMRGLLAKFHRLDLEKSPMATLWLLHLLHEIKQWWIHEADKAWNPPPNVMNENLAVYSYDVQTAYTRTLGEILAAIPLAPSGILHPMTPDDVDRAAKRVLVNAKSDMTLLDVAKAHGDDGGIETLVVALGANNVLDVVIGLKYEWALGDADRVHSCVWSPGFFESDWSGLIDRLNTISADHVILATVPHVTVAPLCSAVGNRLRHDSRYFQYYTHFWLRDRFDPDRDPNLTGDQARAIDSAIDQYNAVIIKSVEDARRAGRDWYVFELAGLLDRLAWRRYLSNPASKPSWWDAVGGDYRLPAPLTSLSPPPDTRFFEACQSGRTAGGLIALDGVHPTTIGYGVMAREVIRVMERAGVRFATPSPVDIDFGALLAEDSLVSDPPPTATADFEILGWLNEHLDMVTTLMRRV